MQSDTAKDHEKPLESRALALAHSPLPEPRPAAPRPDASFLAQLFACETKLEAFRRHRRTTPDRASACYGAQPPQARPCVRFERML
jgi:hypothetical protein